MSNGPANTNDKDQQQLPKTPSGNPLFSQLNTSAPQTDPNVNDAATEIKKKLDDLYEEEPSVKEELKEAEHNKHPSKHQQFLQKLSTSGQPLSDIQTAWHAYYLSLPDNEKHEVWQEFYREHGKEALEQPEEKPRVIEHQFTAANHKEPLPEPKRLIDTRSVSEIKQALKQKLEMRSSPKKGSSFHSLAFGLSMGATVLVILLFGLFNERIIAPFITPSRTVSASPIIVDPNSTDAGPDPKVIIPKINLEIPVVYDAKSVEEKDFQGALEKGAVHYATTSMPGEQGNTAIFGHSSNNILNRGDYKFAFVLLNRLEVGDTFMLTKDGKRYIYKVYDKKVVNPDEFWVLEDKGKPTATLITCDPPGTALKRLVVFGEQINPDPVQNVASTAQDSPEEVARLPGNAPSLWQRFLGWFGG